MFRVAVLLSGSGTNFQAIVEYFENIDDIEIALCISNKKKAFGLERAKKLNVDFISLETKDFESRKAHELKMSQILKEANIDLVVLAGYMLLIKHDMLEWCGKLVNIHPSLLPKFPGMNAIHDTFYSNEEFGGITIHYVDAGMDTGPIVEQKSIKIDRSKGIENYEQEIHKLEHEYYPCTIEKIIRSK